jgi:hypothetical protein
MQTSLIRHRSMGRILMASGLVGLLVLVLPAAAHALGGGGIGGFGDGGGAGGGLSGGGHFFGGGSGGGSEEGSTEILARLLIVVLIVMYWIVGILRVRRTEQRESFSLGLVLRTLRRVALWPVDWVVEWRRLGAGSGSLRRRRLRVIRGLRLMWSAAMLSGCSWRSRPRGRKTTASSLLA